MLALSCSWSPGALIPICSETKNFAAPHLIDSEVTHVLRGLVLRSGLSDEQGAYDATYVALTEVTGATSLLTRCSACKSA